MNFTIDFTTLLSGCILLVLSIGVRRIFTMSTLVTSITQWMVDHETSDIKFHTDLTNRVGHIEQSMMAKDNK